VLAPNPTFKVGVTNNAELEVNVPFAGVHTFGSSTQPSSSVCTFVRAKVNLSGNDGGSSAAALIPYVKAPSAPIGIGNGAVEEGLIAPLALTLPNNFTLLLIPEVDAFKDSADDGRHAKRTTTMTPIVKTTQVSFHTALFWIVLPNVQLDVGTNFGLNSATPAVQVYTGLSQRF
jgi:hypothetical protein